MIKIGDLIYIPELHFGGTDDLPAREGIVITCCEASKFIKVELPNKFIIPLWKIEQGSRWYTQGTFDELASDIANSQQPEQFIYESIKNGDNPLFILQVLRKTQPQLWLKLKQKIRAINTIV